MYRSLVYCIIWNKWSKPAESGFVAINYELFVYIQTYTSTLKSQYATTWVCQLIHNCKQSLGGKRESEMVKNKQIILFLFWNELETKFCKDENRQKIHFKEGNREVESIKANIVLCQDNLNYWQIKL